MLLDRVRQRTDDRLMAKTNAARIEWDGMLDEKASLSRGGDKLHPQAVARLASDLADDNAVFVVDTGEVTLWAANWLRQRGSQRITGSFGNAAVGTGMGIANGVQALDRDRQVILQVGDGGFTMLAGEFMTAVEHKLPVKVVVYDNSGWGLVHIEMEGAGLPATAGAGFPNMDFAAFAHACGAEGFSARVPEELEPAMRAMLSVSGPALLHVIVDPEELPTMPHFDLAQAVRFGIAKAKEGLLSLRGK
ncbi:thiamine pyrophosphate-dependent enzyme [Sphingosinicella sp.]|uniref:thiamine pyrophosphate-dependent enzyme n=1 Tax=Sphingosinicella sp. TaxID=1917971 RepID=UPI0040378725